jgi:hypothetical protein
MVEEGPEGLPDLSTRQALAVMGATGAFSRHLAQRVIRRRVAPSKSP